MIEMRVQEQSSAHAEVELVSGLRVSIRAQVPGNQAAFTRARVTLRRAEIAEFVTGVSLDSDYVEARHVSAERKAMLSRIIEAKPVLELLLDGGVPAATWTRSARPGEELTMEADRLFLYHGAPADIWLRKHSQDLPSPAEGSLAL